MAAQSVMRQLPLEIQTIIWLFYGVMERPTIYKGQILDFFVNKLKDLFGNHINMEVIYKSKNYELYYSYYIYFSKRRNDPFFLKFTLFDRLDWLEDRIISRQEYRSLRKYQRKQLHRKNFTMKLILNAEFLARK